MFLYNMWLDMRKRRSAARSMLIHMTECVERILRDQLTSAYKSVWVTTKRVQNVAGSCSASSPPCQSREAVHARLRSSRNSALPGVREGAPSEGVAEIGRVI